MGDVSTDSDRWGNSATPWSLAAGHGLIRLDELHWHLSYLNDCVYLSISPLFPLPQPLALLLHPPTVQRSRCSSRTRPRRMTAHWACAPLLWTGSLGLYCRGVTSQVAAKRDLGANENIFYWRQTRGSGEWLTKAASRCQRSKHHTNRNTPVATRVTVKPGRWIEFVWQPYKRKKKLINFHGMLSNDVSVVPAFSWRVWSVFKELPWQKDKQMLWDVWPVSWWRAVGILKSNFLVFKRHPSRVDSDFLSSLTAAVCAERCLAGPQNAFGGASRGLSAATLIGVRTNGGSAQSFLTAAARTQHQQDVKCRLQRRHWPWLYKAESQV